MRTRISKPLLSPAGGNVSRRDLLRWSSALTLAACTPASSPGGAPKAKSPAPADKRESQRVLLLGGTGFLGPAIVEAARSRGHTLTLFHRGKTRPGLFPGVEEIFGDRNEGFEGLRGRTWDVVIDTSGYVPKQLKASTEALAKQVAQYVFISTISVYDHPAKTGVDETGRVAVLKDPSVDKVTPETYGALKAACEDVTRTAFGERATIVRPGLIVGPGDPTDRFTYWPVRLERGGDVLAPGDGTDPAQVIDVRDLGTWLVTVVEQRLAGTYNAVGPKEPMTMASMLAAVQRGVGSRANLVWAPTEFLEAQKVAPWSDMPVWVPASDPDDGGMARTRSERAIAKGLTFRPMEDIARDTLAWWKTLPAERTAKLRAGLPADKEQTVIAELKKKKGSAPG